VEEREKKIIKRPEKIRSKSKSSVAFSKSIRTPWVKGGQAQDSRGNQTDGDRKKWTDDPCQQDN